MSHPGRFDRLDLLELRISHVLEQPSAASEQDRDDRDDDLVEQTRCAVLLRKSLKTDSHGASRSTRCEVMTTVRAGAWTRGQARRQAACLTPLKGARYAAGSASTRAIQPSVAPEADG